MRWQIESRIKELTPSVSLQQISRMKRKEVLLVDVKLILKREREKTTAGFSISEFFNLGKTRVN